MGTKGPFTEEQIIRALKGETIVRKPGRPSEWSGRQEDRAHRDQNPVVSEDRFQSGEVSAREGASVHGGPARAGRRSPA